MQMLRCKWTEHFFGTTTDTKDVADRHLNFHHKCAVSLELSDKLKIKLSFMLFPGLKVVYFTYVLIIWLSFVQSYLVKGFQKYAVRTKLDIYGFSK
jgi:hypothetical protein